MGASRFTKAWDTRSRQLAQWTVMKDLRGYADGNLHSRIEKAAKEHLITSDMARWAHEVRLDANDQRHADQTAALPTAQDAARAIDFASALAEILFALPGRVRRGINEAGKTG